MSDRGSFKKGDKPDDGCFTKELTGLSKQIRCGGCKRTTIVESRHSCKHCGRMLCGKCGAYCEDHKA